MRGATSTSGQLSPDGGLYLNSPNDLLQRAGLPNPATRPFTVEPVMSRIHATRTPTGPLLLGNGLVSELSGFGDGG